MAEIKGSGLSVLLAFALLASQVQIGNAAKDCPEGMQDPQFCWEELLNSLRNNSELVGISEFLAQITKGPAVPSEMLGKPVPDLIKDYGYRSEVHHITTEDGYILEAHRIPLQDRCLESKDKRVIWLQHGLMGDSSNYVVTGPNKRALAFELSEECYDVWMGNFRGNTYSKKHINASMGPETTEFWDFSWQEMGQYDVKANIEYALKTSGSESLYYVGHSMGTTTFFIFASLYPELSRNVTLFSALAPVTYMKNTRSLLVRIALPFLPCFECANYVEAANIESTQGLAASLCQYGTPTQDLCALILFLIGGFNKAQLDYEKLALILQHAPAGCSSKAFLHYGQSIQTEKFRMFDHGPTENEIRYGVQEPPEFNLTEVKTPSAIYWSDNDFLADKQDVLKSLSMFAPGVIVNNYRVEDPFFNHLDFVLAKDQHELINRPLMEFMRNFPLKESDQTTEGGSGRAGATFLFSLWLPILCFFYV